MAKADDAGFRYRYRAARRIAKALHLKADDRPAEVLRRIEDMASIYLRVHNADAAQPTPAQVRDRLAALEKRTGELLKAVEKAHPAFDFIAAEICPDGRVDCLIQQINWLDRPSTPSGPISGQFSFVIG